MTAEMPNEKAVPPPMKNNQPRSGTDSANGCWLRRLVGRIDGLEARIKELEKPTAGYKCETCGIVRPANWYIYEIERDGEWIRPCCAVCARTQGKNSRGPYPPNEKLSDGSPTKTI